MKTPFSSAVLAVCLILILWVSCKEPETPKPDDDPGEITSQEADDLLGTMSFLNGTQVTGKVPTSPDIALLQMQVEDTFYAAPGMDIPVRLRHPEGVVVGGFFVAVQNSTFYYDVPVFETQDGDSISVVIFEIKPASEKEPPYNIPVEIIVYDEIKTTIDKIERVITVEKPNEPGCTITRAPTQDSTWDYVWWSTISYNYNNEVDFFNAPGKPFVTETNYQGCCDPTKPDGKCNPLSTTLNATVNFKNLYMIEQEEFTFYSDGAYVRRTEEVKKHFDPTTTQWCAGWAGFSTVRDVVYYTGTHDFTPGATKIGFGAGTKSCDICGYGSPGGDLIYTCHLFAITRNIPGSSFTRIYIRWDGNVDAWMY
ncbi:MAG: hypothetical protein SF052_03590 [Bacteroidia bacterium]|nr:hypothetical protein [Bacteroidia bacterium]